AALRADAKTINDNLAVASLPGTPLAPTVEPSSANGRALGGDTPPAMFANGTVGNGGPYDGIITLNSAVRFKFTRPTSANYFDAQRSTEHEIGEVMGLGSKLGHTGIDLRPQDVFSWSSFAHRNITASGTRYFSINSGSTHVINFNQNPNGDFGDWWSGACPQAHPYVQNAFGCAGQFSDVTATTPEGINLDVIGYDLRSVTGPPIVTTNPATNVARFSSTLRGTVNPSSLSTTVRFQYGRTTSYGHITANQTKIGNNTQPVISNISGLSAGTTYHFRIVATNTAGTGHGGDRTFTTLP
ncbi:MAG TPA: NF038122 family metalloprotease, partial [Candidatus Udaeobacter sp.]